MKDDFYKLIENKSENILKRTCISKLSTYPKDMKSLPEGKPWGTAHAVLSCRENQRTLAVINAMTIISGAFHVVYDFLLQKKKRLTETLYGRI